MRHQGNIPTVMSTAAPHDVHTWDVNISKMKVIKRSGKAEAVSFDKVQRRIQRLCNNDPSKNLAGLPNVDVASISQKVILHLSDGVTTTQLDEYTATMAASMVTVHPNYGELASRVMVSNHHKNTPDSFLKSMKMLMTKNYDKKGNLSPLISRKIYDIAMSRNSEIERTINYNRDYYFDTFGMATLMRGYLLKCTDKNSNQTIIERPQHMIMRVALGIHDDDLDAAFETYNMMSNRYFTHASPTLYNAGTNHPQMSSCFLMTIKDDSIDGIYETLTNCARISKYAGGIGVSVSNVRASGSLIRGTNGKSTGIVPMLRNYNSTARYVNQGGKRLGSFAIYLEPWHDDVMDFLDMRKNHGDEERRCRDLFYALWIPDLFMHRVRDNKMWTLMCPDECPGLSDTHGIEFEELYCKYEKEGRGRRQINARELYEKIIRSQIETGTPYLCYKDSCNLKSNQSNRGTIKSSNLCAEIIEYTDANEIAVCNLASICLPAFVKDDNTYDFETLKNISKMIVKNLNKIIDRNFYPVVEAKNSNMKNRPIGVGVQGLADVFAMMRMNFDSEEAKELNKLIFETIYYGCVESSCELAEIEGPYETFEGSPASKGILQFDMWGVKPSSNMYDWDSLKERVTKTGIRNSLLVALMPTASTSQIMGYSESFEPFSGILYERKTLAGNFKLVNKYLVNDLLKLGLWSTDMKNRIIAAEGSVQGIEDIPKDIRLLYRTVWEIPQKELIDMQADRGPFVCQSASNNLYTRDPELHKMCKMHLYAWKKGLKTGCYYLRVGAKLEAQKFTVDPRIAAEEKKKAEIAQAKLACSRANPEACEMCSA
ncbi:ribonucleoside-diphosphate reductase subunit alpha [Tetraselmis virus 1]|uniref:Ribonucleoside-diphosphate reductase n=1 Tax=Tetraselmis virus 1 TaxID=2060617 RepID=A0A2P0VNU2_9VIRU|nr:ribonucleoside-diphosphate reductase subunit alpha [Tetraselmis virus 1]AUF82540.1 ribonucleoside-diphosphate reductase subunit alpha [Tetraselmis virus 1]